MRFPAHACNPRVSVHPSAAVTVFEETICVGNPLAISASRFCDCSLALNGDTGAVKWAFTTSGSTGMLHESSSPGIGADGTIFVGLSDSTLYVLMYYFA